MHDINSAKGWSLMSSSFRKSFLTHLLIGGVIGILYFIFSHSSFFMNRLITPCFLPVSFPLSLEVSDLLKISEPLTCLFTAIENSGSTGNTMKNLKEENEKIAPASTPELGSYYEYRNSRNVFPSCAGPVLAGSLYLILSLFLTLCTL